MNVNELTHNQLLALVALIEDLAMADGTIAEGEETEIGKLATELGESHYRELIEDANERIPDTKALRKCLLAVTDQPARELILGLAMEEAMSSPSAKHEQWELLEWLKKEWNVTVEAQSRTPGEDDPSR